MKILFQGDSITDGCFLGDRDRDNTHDIGQGYPKYAAEIIKKNFPKTEFEFLNIAWPGEKTKDLVRRLKPDFIDINPDIVSILIGINDTQNNYQENTDFISHEDFENQYETILKEIKQKTNAKILILEPFLFPMKERLHFREDFDPKREIVKKLAEKYADAFIPCDSLFAEAYRDKDWQIYSDDAIHLSEDGAKFVGRLYAESICAIISTMI